jgi:hypothetical protein
MARIMTETELLAELQRWTEATPDREPGVILTKEIVKALGVSRETANLRIDRWLAEGRLEPTRTPFVDRIGRRTSTWGYRIVDAI